MKKLLIIVCCCLLFKSSLAQDTWKERSEFYDVFKTVFESTKEGNTDQLVNKLPEINEKFRAFYKSIDEKFSRKR